MRNQQATRLLFELSHPGRRAVRLPACDVPAARVEDRLPEHVLADAPPNMPELSEPEVIRHFTNLSTLNMSVDTHFYPLGSCTMKYNPKRNERVAALPGMIDVHPLQPDESVQGLLKLLYDLQAILAEISGLPAVSLQPAAGAQGELTALLTAASYFRDLGPEEAARRTIVLTPDSAHGTNPASAIMAGFQFEKIDSSPAGVVDMDDFRRKLDDRIAVLMITNPNTLGLFEPTMREIADAVHEKGGLVYLDGANMNAILGIARPADFGADMQHFNPHKTFSGPHGGGGPGAGPICVTEHLAPFLPVPVLVKDDDTYRLDYDRPKSIGRVRSFFGNVGVLVRTYAYLRTHGAEGLRSVSENAVLNANYLLSRVQSLLPVPQGNRCMHEFVASAAKLKSETNISAMDLAKRLIDYGFHPPTVYFPLTVRESIMVEPTETESKETLDAFADALRQIIGEDPEMVRQAPHTTPISRPDEVRAARQSVVTYQSGR